MLFNDFKLDDMMLVLNPRVEIFWMDSFSDPPQPKTCCFGGLSYKSADLSVSHWIFFFVLPMVGSDDHK